MILLFYIFLFTRISLSMSKPEQCTCLGTLAEWSRVFWCRPQGLEFETTGGGFIIALNLLDFYCAVMEVLLHHNAYYMCCHVYLYIVPYLYMYTRIYHRLCTTSLDGKYHTVYQYKNFLLHSVVLSDTYGRYIFYF
jgi:hypothetical protein